MAKVNVKHGVEGPTHDPYSYKVVTFTKTDGTVIKARCSEFNEWLEINGYRLTISQLLWGESSGINRKFKQLTGLSIQEAEEINGRLEYPCKCKNCGSKKLDSVSGFPGETFIQCMDCNEVVASHFDESAII